MDDNSIFNGKTLLYIFIGIILCLGSLIFVFKYNQYSMDKDKDNSNTSNNEVNDNNNNNTNYNNNYSDIELGFLKLEYNSNNIVYSPLSIRYGLTMLRDGAEGNTLEQINNLLGNNTLNKYSNIKDKIALSNSLYIQNSYYNSINSDYIYNIKNNYNGEILNDEYLSKDRINEWINDNSLGLLNDVVKDDISDQQMLIVNTLAINLDYKYKFDKNDASTEEFNGKYTDTIYKVYDKDQIKYFKEDNLTGVSLELENDLEYIILMPDDLDSYVNSINIDTLKSDVNKLKSNSDIKVRLTMPVYDYEYELKFVSDLKALGCDDMFTDAANFSKINSELYIDDAIHKANISVSYEGIKASAATVFGMKNASIATEDYEYIKINNPFLFIIRNSNNNDIWFIGTVVDLGE